ncbi:MAG: hypothetical protein ACJA0E_001668 [Bermanella sp.]|jgi:hypothetical protein
MKNIMKKALTVGVAVLVATLARADIAIDGQVNYEATAFFNDSLNPVIDQNFNNSLSFESELYTQWDDDNQSLTFKPFYRFDEMDDERTHGDIRELIWHKLSDQYELKAGIGKVYWGVTESNHLVDIVNQTDGVESIDGEEKLGQPMVQLMLERDWGNLDLFVLPYHRERTLAGSDGRLSAGFDYADAVYESDDEENNIDVAARYYSYIDEFEYAVSLFHGNSREPVVGFDVISNQALPYYPIISQLGIELQYLNEGWAWKFEGIHRDGVSENTILGPLGSLVGVASAGPSLTVADDKSYFATTAGFEYTQVGIWESRIDLGWVVEHMYDSRQEKSSQAAFEHDVLLATRWAANNSADSTLLVGAVVDYEYQDFSLSIEGTTRLMEGLSLEIEARVFAPAKDAPLYLFRDEDFVRLTLSYYL